uniref:Beta-1,4-galactosyltransferase n=1 Tax=Mastacembelus armatus TaxID=205130 RepID=A0A7N9AS52_9TELE
MNESLLMCGWEIPNKSLRQIIGLGQMNEYVFMVQARGIQIRENVKNIGVQVLEQVVRGAYSNNGTDYPYDFNMSESDAPPTTYLPEGFTYLPSQVCPEKLPSMKGRLEVNMSEVSLEEVERSLLEEEPSMASGGYWRPKDCLPRWKVAILVPFRNRHEHLPILLRHLVPVLQKQRLQFAFYVIEQMGTEPFNRAMLFNVGFKEAMKDLNWDCLVFHDVDHLMENDRNYYGCTDMPRHFAVKLDKYSYMLPYNEFFGGVSGLTVKQFKKINGFPNAFWGWGGEDDDLWNRVQFASYTVSRPHGDQGRYMSIQHHHRGEVQFLGRYSLLRHSKERQKLDGLNNLNYSPLVSRRPLYTNITVSLSRKLAPIADY